MKIYQILKEHNARGKENAMTTERLMELSGLTQREIVAQVKEERKRHFIGSTTQRDGGYYRPANFKEIEDYSRQRERRIKLAALTMRPTRWLNKRRGQGGRV
ncbi:hypothetical protein [Acidaminococcus fermentans]